MDQPPSNRSTPPATRRTTARDDAAPRPTWMRRVLSLGLTAATGLGLGIPLLSQGCTVSEGDFDGGFFDFDTGLGSSEVCNECLLQECSAQWAVCRASADCLGIYQCATAPGCDQACVFDCYSSRPNGQSAYYALAACDCTGLLGTCAASCPGVSTAGCLETQVDGGPLPDASSVYDAGVVQDCATCTNQLCGAEKANCGAGTQCDAYTQCLAGCADAPCVDRCATTYAAGFADSQKLSACVLDSCRIACGF